MSTAELPQVDTPGDAEMQRMRVERGTLLDQADAISAKAVKDNRAFTSTERAEVYNLLERVKEIDKRVSKGVDAWFRKQISDFGDSIGLGDSPASYGTTPPAFPAAKTAQHPWSSAALKAVTGTSVHGMKELAATGTVLVGTTFDPVPVRQGERPTSVLALLPSRRTETNHFSYLRQTRRELNARPVARGQVKPESPFELTGVEDRCRVVAHLSEPVARQDLADNAALQDFLGRELAYGVSVAEESQVVAGDGTGENMTGILNTEGIVAQPFDTDLLVTTRMALVTQQELGNSPGAWVFNPRDWGRLELLREGAAGDGGFMLGNAPVDRAAQRLWGLPTVVSPAMPVGRAILGDFAGSAVVFRREGTVVSWTESMWRPNAGGGADLFALNEVVWRAESRLGFAVTRPSAFCEVDMTA